MMFAKNRIRKMTTMMMMQYNSHSRKSDLLFVTTMKRVLLAALLVIYFIRESTSFTICQRTRRLRNPFSLAVSSDSSNSNGDSSSKSTWMDDLRARLQEVEEQQKRQATNWRQANEAKSSVATVLPDWVRRIDVDGPFVACGSASGTIYVSHIESGQIVATGQPVDDTTDENDNIEATLRILYGSYDGGGTLAIAFAKNVICDARRCGGVYLHLFDPASQSDRLVSQGSIPALDGVLVTSLEVSRDDEGDFLWVGTADGRVQAYSLDDDERPLALQAKPTMEWNLTSTITSIAPAPELGIAAVTVADGSVRLLSLEQHCVMGSFYPPFDSSERKSAFSFALSSAIVKHRTKPDRPNKYSVICGGNDGSLFAQPLEMFNDQIDPDRPFRKALYPLLPKHFGAIACMASPTPGLLVSAGRDGTMRVWDIDQDKCLYQFVGYKVWIGSLWTDGSRLLSDGSDNTVIQHDFR